PYNGYTSLSDLILDFNNDTLNFYDEVKTWGTVSKVYFNSSGSIKSFYIESTSREGKSAAMLIYNYRGDVNIQENNVLTVTGYVSIHNNRPQMIDPLVTIDYLENSSPVTPFIFNEEFLIDSNASAFFDRVGPIRVKMEDVYLTAVSDTTALVRWPGGYYAATLYYNSLYTQDDIWSKLYDSYYDDEIITLYGFLDVYGGWPQVLLRDPDDIITSTSGTDPDPDHDPTLITLDLFDYSYPNIGRYATGNYGSSYVNDFNLSFYRLHRGSRYTDVTFLPFIQSTSDGTIGAAFFNNTPIKGITNFSIRYRTDKLTGTRPILHYGANKLRTEKVTLPLSTSYNTFNFPVEDVNFFNLVASDAALYVSELNVTYSDTGSVTEVNYFGSGENLYRLNPVTSSGALYEGKQVTVPINVSTSSSGYTVLATKTYTYYSFDYIEDNLYSFNDVSEFAYTDPVDLAAFFNAFKTYPANYVPIGSANFSRAKSVFGYDARQVSYYTRTDGYALSVPWRSIPGQNKPAYYELDLDLDGDYYYGSRGVGRLVCWEYGFDAPGYDTSPVSVYTDDHYETFQEYLNTGYFGERFNSARNRTNYVWSAPITL
ncbi:MAG TPA: hypothetical protein VFD05_01715, partial [Bacilli bacterium]|nr:hypothetical protein [Bacilli bacterium]